MSKQSKFGSGKVLIDVRIFRESKLTIFEAFVKFLKEEKVMSYHEIGALLDRDERNIWTVYNRTKKKLKQFVVLKKSKKILIDIGIFKKTKLTIFEAFVKFLKEEKVMTYHEIGALLDRDERNIWTVYNRGKKKV